MALDFGSGVSRTLDAAFRQFGAVVWQKGKPPLDSELNLMSQQAFEALRQTVRTMLPSGFFLDPTRSASDFQTNPSWANLFKVGNPRVPFGFEEGTEKAPVMWANVNGMIVPICGTDTVEGDLANVIKLYPPPESDTRIDFLFLEVWATRVDANPSTVNKPSASTIWKYGNVKFGGTNMADDLEDPTLGYETTARVQIQYRLRVHGSGTGLGGSVALDVYPDGLGDPHVLGQGTSANPVAAMTFLNMREELGDPGLWRAGDGNPNNSLGTIDGYTFAIPVCAVFRRSSNVYVAVNQAGNPNHNGAFCRTPSTKFLANPLVGARALTTATLTGSLSASAADDPAGPDAVVSITDLNGSGLEDSHVLNFTYLMLDDEIVGISAKDLVLGTITIPAGGRGRYGTASVGHPAGTVVRFFNTRPDGLYSDQITAHDILDLRHGVNANDWDYSRLLEHNIAALLKGDLRSTWKHAAAGNTQGAVTHEVTYLWGDGSLDVPNHTEPADGPDGIRTIWSDAATVQPGVTVLLDNTAPQDGNNVGLTNENRFTSGAGYAWDVGADLYPSGFMNVGADVNKDRFCNGTTIFLFTGGRTGSGGARATFRDGTTRAVRLVTPKEYWKSGYPIVNPENGGQSPITLRFLTERANEPAPPSISSTAKAARHVGPFYPWRETNFELPFIVLGGLLRNEMRRTSVAATELTTAGLSQINVGIDFDLLNSYYTQDANGEFSNDPKDPNLTNPVLRASRTLFGMLTANGTDTTGRSSEVYVVLYGDKDSRNNNGAFKVIGAGTVGYTSYTCTGPNAATSIIVAPLSPEFMGFDSATGNTVTVEFRSQESNSDDTSSYDTKVADVAIVLTDIGGLDEHPWKNTYLGYGATDGYDISMPLTAALPGGHASINSKLLIDLTLLYHPGRSGTVRVPDEIVRFAMKGGTTDTNGAYLRQSPAAIDTTFSPVGTPTDETFWPPAHVQLWNRLPSLGWPAPDAPNYGGNVVGFTEQDREHELFFDRGSKTVLFRPFRDRRMTLQEVSWSDPDVPTNRCLMGEYVYSQGGHQKDALRMWTGNNPDQGGTGKKMGFVVPWEFMPRFGRQDIPCYQDQDVGTGPFLSGINHLFRDEANVNSPVFHIIGGSPTASGAPAVYSMFFVTGGLGGPHTAVYGQSDTMPTWTNQEFIYARRAPEDINVAFPYAQGVVDKLAAVNSSDFGRGLKGIQLPPYYGIARLYGVYDVRDFDNKGGRSFKANRVEMEANPAVNLIREDADQQTLFILQGGGKDFGGNDGDHTYLIPYNLLDVTRSPTYDPNTDTPENMHYVVECVIFGFARGFIDQNNMVMVRKFGGTGLGIDGGVGGNEDLDNLEIEGLHMVLPCPAAFHDQFYTAYNRTVYQGDPFMSRGGAKTESDYETRYGQLSVGAQYAMRTPIEQYDQNGVFVPQIPNAKAFEVLASMDFYTTMGTGKIGGQLYAGTPLDVGFTEATPLSSRRLMNENDVPWRVLPRAFTEGQKSNLSRAGLGVAILDNTMLDTYSGGSADDRALLHFDLLDGSRTTLWFSKAGASETALLVAHPDLTSADVVTVDVTSHPQEFLGTYTFANPTTIAPGTFIAPRPTVTIAGAAVGDAVICNWSTSVSSPVTIRGYVTAPDTVTLLVSNLWTPAAYLGLGALAQDIASQTLVATLGGGNVPAQGMTTLAPLAFTGATVGDGVVVHYKDPTDEDGLFFTGVVNAAGFVTITVHNPTGGAIGPWAGIHGANRDVVVSILEPMVAASYTYPVSSQTVLVRVLHTLEVGEAYRTAANLATKINFHPDLMRSLTASVTGDNLVSLVSVPTGEEGNRIKITARHLDLTGGIIQQAIALKVPYSNDRSVGANITSSFLLGGKDVPFNAGDGTSQINLTGMTERLPMGALLQDSDFLCENPLGDNASAVKASPTGPRPIQTVMPLTAAGGEYTRFFGEPGELLALADGSISVTSFGAWRHIVEGGGGPTGSRKFRSYRGGSAFTLSGDNPGAPVDWVSETFPAPLQPVLKGGVLACRAMLVRNYREDVTPSGSTYKVSDGDEIQMVVITNGLLGDGHTQEHGISLGGSISPSGYGEGWAAADRYRIDGKPLFRGYSRQVPNPADVSLVVYPDQQRD